MVKVSGGSRQAFEALYERFKRPIMSYLYQMVQDQTVAEELTQEVFLKVYRARESYRPDAKFSTWLWTIAKNAAYDHLRKKTELPTLESESGDSVEIEQLESPVTNAEAALIEDSRGSAVNDCIAALSPGQREALTLRTVSELSYEEIAQTMGTSLSSVKSLINRAKASLTRCLEGKAG